jgi:hypothetical protein
MIVSHYLPSPTTKFIISKLITVDIFVFITNEHVIMSTRSKTTELIQNSEIVDVIPGSAKWISPFSSTKIELWLQQIKAQFEIANITKDDLKFGYIVVKLDSRGLKQIENVI